MALYKNLYATEFIENDGDGPQKPNSSTNEKVSRRYPPATILESADINGEKTKFEMRLHQVDANGAEAGKEIVVPRNGIVAVP